MPGEKTAVGGRRTDGPLYFAYRLLPAGRLGDLKLDIGRFAESEELNGFQRYIVEQMYGFGPPDGFSAASVAVVAVRMPAYAKVGFSWRGKRIPAVCLVAADGKGAAVAEIAGEFLEGELAPAGHRIAPAPALPLKRLAAASGLAAYGRNNICYVEGMGSFFSLAAFYTDAPCASDPWTEIRIADACEGCGACLRACPTGAIRPGRFLIDNEKCLSFFNEGPGEFPAWLPRAVHHCLYDCLKCQLACPMNREHIGNVAGPIEFSEEETGLLLYGASIEEFEPRFLRKVKYLGIDKWYPAIPRNLKLLLENA
jgi:epoxyqueuosine reductase